MLNDQFVSAYTPEDTQRTSYKEPCPHPAMQKINVTISGIIKLLPELHVKPYKISSFPAYILKMATEEISPFLSKIFQTHLDR